MSSLEKVDQQALGEYMEDKILIVDDSQINRELLKGILSDRYQIMEAYDGRMALELIDREKEHLSAILLDLVMPQMDGFAVLSALRDQELLEQIPVLAISGETSSQMENKCFDYGVVDFIGKPYNASIVRKRVENSVSHFRDRNHLKEKVEEQTVVLRKAYRTLQAQAQQLHKRNLDIIEMLGTIVEFRSLESGEHIQRVKGYTRILANAFASLYPESGLTKDSIEVIATASALHDVGKIAIPDGILLKPGKLTPDEFDYMKSHTLRGCEIIQSMKKNWDPEYQKACYEICRSHHERYDGKGYPDGLKGDEIPLSAQLVSVADVYDALINERCYKCAYSKADAFHMIISGECGMFAPKLMEAFRSVHRQFEEFSKKSVE